ncbi:hypothetical protein NQZ68_001080 [Dissostichus eleginoides]|nr:hypothetical protein NQZ68_001080 [Dissostichus eleginoides]
MSDPEVGRGLRYRLFPLQWTDAGAGGGTCAVCGEGRTPVTRVTATDADDPVYGNSAKLVYSILEGQPYFSVDPNTDGARHIGSEP